MSLVYGFSRPKDLLDKLRRERDRLDAAVKRQDDIEIADYLFNMVVTAFHIKDWLIQNQQGQNYTKSDVEEYITQTKALSTCRDLCNTGKHFIIDRYFPQTQDVYSSLGASMVIKVSLSDGTKYKAVELANQAIDAWDVFFNQYTIN
jgi:hypothetical protein